MTRVVLALLLLPIASTWAAGGAEDALARIRNALKRGAFQDAVAEADDALVRFPDDNALLYHRAQGVRGLARNLQRAEGYDAAIEFLEPQLTHALLVVAYAEACKWGGREERGIARLRESELPLADRLYPELDLISQLRRYDEVAERARAAGDADWLEWATEKADGRNRRLARGRRGWWVAGVALVVLAAAACGLFRLAPTPSSAPPTARRAAS